MADMISLALQMQNGTIEHEKISIAPGDDEYIWYDLIGASYEGANKFLFYLHLTASGHCALNKPVTFTFDKSLPKKHKNQMLSISNERFITSVTDDGTLVVYYK